MGGHHQGEPHRTTPLGHLMPQETLEALASLSLSFGRGERESRGSGYPW